MTDNVTTELLLEHMKRMNTRFDRLEQTLRESVAAAAEDRAHTLELMSTTGRHEDRFNNLTARIERIERKLDPTD